MSGTTKRGSTRAAARMADIGRFTGLTGVLAGMIAGIAAIFGLNPVAALLRTGHRLGAMFVATWPFWAIVVAGVVAAAVHFQADTVQPRPNRGWNAPQLSEEEAAELAEADARARVRHGRWTRAANGVTVVVLLASLPLVFFTVRSVNRFGHDSKHDAIVSVLTEEDGFNPDFDGRLPYPVAERKLIDSVGEGGGLKVEGVWRFDVAGTPKTCGILMPEKNAWKRPVAGVVCVDDDGHVERVSFEGPQVPSWKVATGSLRLKQVVNDLNPQSTFVISDIYGYIVDGKPTMVVPTTKLCGKAHYVTGWAGVVVFDNDGARLVTEPAGLYGPVAGESLANEVLGGLNHRGGFLASRKNLGNFDATGNDANPTHHLLTQADGKERLVTLLTPKGDSNTPVAALEIDPTDVELCQWPKAVLYRFPAAENGQIARASVAEAEQTVTQRYGAALQLENTKLVILETQLTGTDEVTIALGSDRQVLTYIAFNLQTRESTVYDRDRTEIRRDPANATVGPQGLRELFVDDAPTPAEPIEGTPVPSGNLAGLSDQELIRLLGEIASELEKRSR